MEQFRTVCKLGVYIRGNLCISNKFSLVSSLDLRVVIQIPERFYAICIHCFFVKLVPFIYYCIIVGAFLYIISDSVFLFLVFLSCLYNICIASLFRYL